MEAGINTRKYMRALRNELRGMPCSEEVQNAKNSI